MGFPQCRVVGILDLSTGAVIDVAFSACKGKGSGEQALLRQLLDSSLNAGDVLVGDAFYPSYFLLWALQLMGGVIFWANKWVVEQAAPTFVAENRWVHMII